MLAKSCSQKRVSTVPASTRSASRRASPAEALHRLKDRDNLLAAVIDKVGREYLDGLVSAADDGGGDVFTLARRFVRTATAPAGSYPLAQKGGVRRARRRSSWNSVRCAIRRCDASTWTSSRGRRSVWRAALGAAQKAGLVRGGREPARLASALMLVVLGAQTIMNLGARFDAGATAAAVLSLLGPGPQPTCSKQQ